MTKVTKDAYIIDGKHYVRVTKILDIIAKPEFFRWYAKNGYEFCENVKTVRAEFGTRVHKEIQNYLEGKDVWVDDDEMHKTMGLFSAWADSHSISPKHLEYHVRSDVYMYAGTVDFIGFFDGVFTIIDWKTSKKVYDNYFLQVAAYLAAFEEQHPDAERIQECRVVCFRDGKISSSLVKRERALELFEYFKCARKLYEWKYGK